MSNAIISRTFCNRRTGCYYYKEKDNYIKYIDILFSKLLKTYTLEISFLDYFSKKFSSTSYTGIRFVLSKDRKLYKEVCLKCALNINQFLLTNKLTNIGDIVTYKGKIKCFIGGILENKPVNIHFCYRNLNDMQKDLDFYLLNNYIYNTVKGLQNNCLIFNVQSGIYVSVKYEDYNYTMKRGFLKSIINSNIRKQGEYCLSCKNTCKPMFINGLDRLNSIT